MSRRKSSVRRCSAARRAARPSASARSSYASMISDSGNSRTVNPLFGVWRSRPSPASICSAARIGVREACSSLLKWTSLSRRPRGNLPSSRPWRRCSTSRADLVERSTSANGLTAIGQRGFGGRSACMTGGRLMLFGSSASRGAGVSRRGQEAQSLDGSAAATIRRLSVHSFCLTVAKYVHIHGYAARRGDRAGKQ